MLDIHPRRTMLRFVPTRLHGAIDYLVPAAMLALPFLAGWQGGVRWAYVALAGFGIGYSMITNYEWGIVRLLPMHWHLALDLVFGTAMLLIAAIVGLSAAGWISIVIGAAALTLAGVTEQSPRRALRGTAR